MSILYDFILEFCKDQQLQEVEMLIFDDNR